MVAIAPQIRTASAAVLPFPVLDQRQMPIVQALAGYWSRNFLPFSMPGHKRGAGPEITNLPSHSIFDLAAVPTGLAPGPY